MEKQRSLREPEGDSPDRSAGASNLAVDCYGSAGSPEPARSCQNPEKTKVRFLRNLDVWYDGGAVSLNQPFASHGGTADPG